VIDLPEQPADLYEIEALLRRAGHASIAGVDEAGRGPLAGPVVAAAVILPAALSFPGLNDSKKLTERRRDVLFKAIHKHPEVISSIAIVTAHQIDKINILKATHRAMRQAVNGLTRTPDLALIDGKPVKPFPVPSINLIKGDGRAAAVAAAGILAKVTRDQIMCELNQRYPVYGFAVHKGYGTPQHLDALNRYGPCREHRTSFRPVADAAANLPKQSDLPLSSAPESQIAADS
jgi:ribonuclease HII